MQMKVVWSQYQFQIKKVSFSGNVSAENTKFDTFDLFINCPSLKIIDLKGLDTSKTASMCNMFCGCNSLTSIDLTGLNTSGVTNMSGMFSGCPNLTSIDLTGLNTSSVTEMFGMFSDCTHLTSINLTGINTRNVLNMDEMFDGCDELTDIALDTDTVFRNSTKINWTRYKLLDGTKADGPSIKFLTYYDGTEPGWYTTRACPNGHLYGEWTTTKAATENAEGLQTRTCSVCGYKETQTIPQLTPSTPSVTPTTPTEIIDLPTVKISKPAAGKKKVTVKWKKVSKKNLKKIGGIQIQIATDPGFTNIVKTATVGKKKTSKTIKGLQAKTKYYVRIRAYAAGNHVSAWKSKSLKVK